jgi:hypothetical protein
MSRCERGIDARRRADRYIPGVRDAPSALRTPRPAAAPLRLDAGGVLALRRVAGNRAAGRALSRQAAAVEVGTFHPAPNITVERTGSSMRISGTV